MEYHFSFLNYTNEESDDVIYGLTKTVQHSIKNISRNIKDIKAVFFELGTRNEHHKRNKMTALCVVAMATVMPPVLFSLRLEFRPRFYLKQGSSTRNNLIGRAKTIWEPRVLRARPSVPLGFSQEETGAKNVAMATV